MSDRVKELIKLARSSGFHVNDQVRVLGDALEALTAEVDTITRDHEGLGVFKRIAILEGKLAQVPNLPELSERVGLVERRLAQLGPVPRISTAALSELSAGDPVMKRAVKLADAVRAFLADNDGRSTPGVEAVETLKTTLVTFEDPIGAAVAASKMDLGPWPTLSKVMLGALREPLKELREARSKGGIYAALVPLTGLDREETEERFKGLLDSALYATRNGSIASLAALAEAALRLCGKIPEDPG